MKKIIFILVSGICIGLIIGIVLYFAINRSSQPPIDDGNRERIDHRLSLLKAEEVAKLVSIEYFMADVVDYKDEKIWPFSDKKILVIAKAKILAGFDLNRGFNLTVHEEPKAIEQSGQEDRPLIERNTRRLVVSLPSPQIIAIDPDYKYYDIQGDPPPEAHTYVLNLAKVQLHQAALNEGILEKAKASITNQLTQIFSDFDLAVVFSNDTNMTETGEKRANWPESVDEAVDIFLSRLSNEEKEHLSKTPQQNLIKFHYGLGSRIRNDFGLWAGNTQLLLACGKNHPDDASQEILEQVWIKLQNTQ
jgi:hypothetical protein